jgi:hypothetical protein
MRSDKSAFGGIVLHNSAGPDCRAFVSCSRPPVYALPFVCCSSRSQVSMRGKQLPEVAGRGREAWPAASGFAQLLSVALRL